MLTSMQANAHCIWICTACKNILAKARFSNAMVSADRANNAIVESLKTEIKDGILAEIRTEFQENFKKLTAAQNAGQKQFLGPAPGKRQRDENDQSSEISAKRVVPYTQGATECNENEAAMFSSSSTMESTEPLFWLYMRGFRPDVTEETVSQWVQQKLETDAVKVRKLVPRGRDIRELSFVSFRVGMPIALKDRALCSDTWPRVVKCREFEDRSQQGFDPAIQQVPETQNAPVNPSPPQLINPALSEEPQLNPAAPPGESQLKTPVTSPPRDLTQPMSV